MVTRDFYKGKGLKKYATGKFMNPQNEIEPQNISWACKYYKAFNKVAKLFL